MAPNETGIVELDEMLRGGFMDKDAVITTGSTGTGKTTLGLEYLVNGATRNTSSSQDSRVRISLCVSPLAPSYIFCL